MKQTLLKFSIATAITLGLLFAADPIHAQNPFPPKAGTTKTTYYQECSGLTSKGAQCKRMVHISAEDYKTPKPQYCFQHKKLS